MPQPAVFLDRDNTLIANDGDLGDPDAVELLDGVPEGLRSLRRAGFRLIVVTNQGGVARGRFTEEEVDAVHQRIAMLVDEQAETQQIIDRFYYCPYHPKADLEEYRRDHPWRKPNPGMLLQASRDLNIDLRQSWLIGDQGRDVAAGQAAGCRTILLENGHPNGSTANGAPRPTAAVPTFGDAVQRILDAPDRTDAGPRPAAAPTTDASPADAIRDLKRAVDNLTDEIRTERQRQAEFTGWRLAAGLMQLLTLLLALLGLLQLDSNVIFMQWMLGAALCQLVTLTILVLDLKG